MMGSDTISVVSASTRGPRIRPNRRAHKREKQGDIAEVSRTLARETSLSTELEMGSLPMAMYPLLEEALDSEDDCVMHVNCCDGIFQTSDDSDDDGVTESSLCGEGLGLIVCDLHVDVPSYTAIAGVMVSPTAQDHITLRAETANDSAVAGFDYPSHIHATSASISSGHGSKRKCEVEVDDHGHEDAESDCSNTCHTSFTAGSLEDYYGPMKNALLLLRGELGKDHPADVQGLVHITTVLEDARSKLVAAFDVRPTFGPVAAGDVRELLDMQLLDRRNANEFVVGPGPFEWGDSLKITIANWSTSSLEDRENALEDATFEQETYRGTLDYCLETFEDHMTAESQHRDFAYG